jgi:4,5-DOPA dioxygenase extradiol
MSRLPVLFVSHGSPMTALDPGRAGTAWRRMAREAGRPRAVVIVSAHWETDLPMVTGGAHPETIHDFGGFPDALYAIRYPAPGAPDVAAEVVASLKAAGITAGIDGCRGLDHGAWVPLMHMFPDADVPVVQLSVQPARGAEHHIALGRAIAPLSAKGVLIVGSGHATHNLRDWRSNATGPSDLRYVGEFSEWIAQRLASGDDDALAAWKSAPDALRAHPSDEHFLPLLVAYGAAGERPQVERVHAEIVGRALAMDAYRFSRAA